MNPKGFQELSQKIDASTNKRTTPNLRYYTDLLSDANIAVKKDNIVGRKTEYIDVLLEFAGFSDWQHWENHLAAAGEYIQTTGLDLSSISKMESGICFSSLLNNKIHPVLSFVKRNTDYGFQLVECQYNEIEGQMNFVKEQLDEFPFVIWAIPVAWKDQLPLIKDNASWENLMQSRRIIPIWIGESGSWDDKSLVIPWLTHRKTISGISGLLGALIYLQGAIQKYLSSQHSNPKDNSSFSRVQNFQHSRGTFLLGDVQIKSENTALGDIHQVIHNHKNKSDDTI